MVGALGLVFKVKEGIIVLILRTVLIILLGGNSLRISLLLHSVDQTTDHIGASKTNHVGAKENDL